MIQIRSEQMKAFENSMKEPFIKETANHLRNDFAEQIQRQKLHDIESLVRSGIASAENYGIFLDADVRSYVEFMVLLGPDFDNDPACTWAGDILRRDDIDAEQKMDLLNEAALFEPDQPL